MNIRRRCGLLDQVSILIQKGEEVWEDQSQYSSLGFRKWKRTGQSTVIVAIGDCEALVLHLLG